MATTTLESPPAPSLLDRPLAAALALTWEKVLYALLIVAGFITRFYDLGARAMSHDESLHTEYAWYLFQGRGFQHSPLMHGVLRFEVTAFTYWLFGDNDFTARIATSLLGVVAIALLYFFRQWLGRAGALVAAGLMLISPYMLYYSRYIRDEPYMVVWGLLIALCVLRYLETRAAKYLYWLTAVTALLYATMEASFIYVAISMLFLGLHLVRELLAVRWQRADFRRGFLFALMLLLLAGVAAAGLQAFEKPAATGTATAVPADPEAAATTAAPAPLTPGQQGVRLALGIGAVALLGVCGFALAEFRGGLRRFAAFDVLMIFGLFVLPQLTAFPVRLWGRLIGQNFTGLSYTLPSGVGLFQFLFYTDAGFTIFTCLVLLGLTLALGLLWDTRTFLICAAIFYSLFVTLFTTFFTNGAGLATGLIGSLAYWLEQHGVQRGNQPWYYYAAINIPLYEFLPAIGALLAAYYGLRQWLRVSDPADDTADVEPPAEKPLRFPVIGYFGFWAVAALVAFSIAGEKMPWLTTHITLPLILASGWSIGKLIDGANWPAFRERRAWLVALLLPLTVVALAAALGALLGQTPPFQGSDLAQLQATGLFISSALVAGIGLVALYGLGLQLGFHHVLRLAGLSVFGLLALLTARAAFIAAYINYDYANEFLVYAHASRGVKTVMTQIEDLSYRIEDGLGLKVAYDSDVAWPMTWYFRDFINQSYYGDQPTRESVDAPVVIAGPKHWSKVEALLGDRYYMFEYIRMVWPYQGYFSLDWPRVSYALGNAQWRQALWNIWFNRDYKLYGELTDPPTNFDLSEWPVSERMRLYVRKDVASQIWSYGVGPTVLEGNAAPEDPYIGARQDLAAITLWGSEGVGQAQFNAPRGVAVAADGSVYVADSRNNRIQKFDSQGNLLLTWGAFGSLDAGTAAPGAFNEPWGVAVGPDGSLYVTDTWNHRVQKFDADGNFLTMWGTFGQGETAAAFWGPRGIAVDGQGRVYVADTGNKRIVVFDSNGVSLNTIGGGGSDPGQFDEPVGVAVTADGTVFVADTWNQRVQVFQWDSANATYLYVREWPVVGWYGQSLDNKPFLAVDGQKRVYVADPEGYRVLVFDQFGKFLTTWGDYGVEPGRFALVGGLALDSAGDIYVADPGNQRLMKFAPLTIAP
ncbi:MAG: SMP-30/gluconolactonase/LRE family protein [Anaerolineales bacterium]|nr:SMP-30/gluconolactonase/LRE family protein [Anaerolineales bacterium]